MSTVADLRVGRSSYAAVVAAASAFVPITLVAWVSWQAIEGDRDTLLRSQFSQWALVTFGAAVLIEGDRDTLLRSQFSQWALVTFGAAVLTCVAAGVFWRSRKMHLGVALGTLLAGLAVAGGLLVDLVGSGGLA